MLIINVMANEKEIETIHIQNAKVYDIKTKKDFYRIMKPKEMNHIEIWHDRKKPWYHLVNAVTSEMMKFYKEETAKDRELRNKVYKNIIDIEAHLK